MLCRKFGVDVKNFAIDRIPEELAGKSPKEIRAELSKTRSAMSEIGSRVSEEIYRRRADRNKEQKSASLSESNTPLKNPMAFSPFIFNNNRCTSIQLPCMYP